MPTITVNAKVPATIEKEGDVFIAVCPLLDVASQGCTADEAKKNLIEAIGLFIGTCLEMGTFIQVMKECGFESTNEEQIENNTCDQIDITLPFFSAKKLAECRA